jgi:hypothetical protein
MACGRTHFKFCLLHLIVEFTTFSPIETPNWPFAMAVVRHQWEAAGTTAQASDGTYF